MPVSRQSISSESLKRVIIRYDFKGVTSIDAWIAEIKQKYCSKFFREYNIGEHGQATIDVQNLEEISERLSIPLSEVSRQPLHLFSGSTFNGLQDLVQLEITRFSITLVVECRNYVSIEPYLDFINTLVLSLLDTDAFIRIERIGIRKLDGFQFETWNDLVANLNSSIIGSLTDLIEDTALLRDYTDSWYWKQFRSKINFKRKIRNVQLVSEDHVYQVVLDMDAYTDDEIIQIPDIINEGFLKEETQRLNNALFEIFIKSITEQYIMNHGKE